MPELPEVESVRRTLKPKIINKTISKVEWAVYPRLFRPSPSLLAEGINGRKILKVGRRGKLLILELTGQTFFTIHLGMTGQLIVAALKPPAAHIHLAAWLGGEWLFFRDPRRFGALAYYPAPDALEAALKKMGPDALKVDDETFIQRLAKRQAPIKTLLLNQAIVCGVGNIYADEALHLCGIAPTAKAGSLPPDKLAALNQALKRVMRHSLALGGSTVKNFVDAQGKPGTFQEEHLVYQRAGRPCAACGQPIARIVLGGRATHYCPNCQKN